MKRVGRVQVYTGDGKGKTTAAMGQAVRALGHGHKVLIIQFLKGRSSGELGVLEKMDNVTIERFGSSRFVCGNPTSEDTALAEKGFKKAREEVLSGHYDLV